MIGNNVFSSVTASRTCNRRRRTKFTDEQLSVLEKAFKNGSKFPSPGERIRLEIKTGLSKDKISVWFQNRRAKEKRATGKDEGSKESTTTDSELETEDEKQLSTCEETPEEDSEIEDMRNLQNRTNGDFQLTTPRNPSANTHNAFKLPHPGDMSNIASNVKQPHDIIVHAIPSTSSKFPQCLGETSALVSSGLYHSEVQEARNHPNNGPSVNSMQTQHADVDDNAPFHVKHMHNHGHVSAHSPTAEKNCMPSSKLYCNEIEETGNYESNPTSVTKLEHPGTVCKNSSTDIGIAYQAGQCEYRKDTEPIRNYQNTPGHIKSLNPEAVHSSESNHNETKDTRKDQNNTSSNMEVSEEQTNIPSYMVLTLPCGTIAVESTEVYRRNIEETQIYENIASDNKLHPTTVLTNTPTEVKVPYAGGTTAVDVSGIYGSDREFDDARSSEDYTDQDANVIHKEDHSGAAPDGSSENNTAQVLPTEVENNAIQNAVQERSSDNGTAHSSEALPAEVQKNLTHYEALDRSSENSTAQGVKALPAEVDNNAALDTGGAVADEMEGIYCSESLNTSSFLPPLQPTTSCFDEMPRNRVSVGADKVPDAMTTPLSSNDVITSIEKNIDNVENRDDDVSGKVDTKEDMMDDKKTQEDMQMQ